MTFTNNEDLTFATRYSVRVWSHDMSRIANPYTDDDLLKRYIQLWVLKQSLIKVNIKAIPIVVYHRAGDNYVPNYNTDVDLFEREWDTFTIIISRNIYKRSRYQDKGDYLYIISAKDLSLTGRIGSVSDIW